MKQSESESNTHPSGNSVYEKDRLRKCDGLQFIVTMAVKPSVNKQRACSWKDNEDSRIEKGRLCKVLVN